MRPVLSMVLFSAALIPGVLSAGDVFLGIGGSVGVFRTDARILNPSGTETITIEARLLPVGNVNNSNVAPRSISIGPREMAVYDDVVASLFQASGVGAIRLTSPDEFVATQRIYALTDAGTLGQFVPGIEASDAISRGVLIQLKASQTFRTNIGAVNPGGSPATVVWRLHDRNNALVATGAPIVMPPYGVINPTAITSNFFFNPGQSDISDAWVSFTSDRPIVAYASVVDNGTTDPTYITASVDTGDEIPQPIRKILNVDARQFTFSLFPAPSFKVGDEVEVRLTSSDVVHGFSLVAPDGTILVEPLTMNPSATAPVIRTFRATLAGTYNYFCTHALCGEGHNEMTGAFTVAP